MPALQRLIDHLFRKQYGKMVSVLVGRFGIEFLEAAEDVVQETMIAAAHAWSYGRVPDNPEAWLMRVALNKAINQTRRDASRIRAQRSSYESTRAVEVPDAERVDAKTIDDDMLAMFFACCHPAIAQPDQVALVLKTLCGFSAREIAGSLLMSEEAISKRIYRAKQQIRREGVELAVPAADERAGRLHAVCTCIYLLFNEGYNSRHSEELIRRELCLEAVSLNRLLLEHYPQSTLVLALMALMSFHVARFDARLDSNGAIVILEDQDRTLWNRELIAFGADYLSRACRGDDLTSFHLEALIAHEHCRAESFDATNWAVIREYYQALQRMKPSPVIRLNLAVITSLIEGPQAAVHELTELLQEKSLSNYYLLYATLADLYARLGDPQTAAANLEQALQLTASPQERALISKRLDALRSGET